MKSHKIVFQHDESLPNFQFSNELEVFSQVHMLLKKVVKTNEDKTKVISFMNLLSLNQISRFHRSSSCNN